jgi:hypothetical protein
MLILKILFWTLLFVVFYTYVGYGILLFFLVRLKRIFSKKSKPVIAEDYEPR